MGWGKTFGIPKTSATFWISWLSKLASRSSSHWSISTSCLAHQLLSRLPTTMMTTMSLDHQHLGPRQDRHLEQPTWGHRRVQHLGLQNNRRFWNYWSLTFFKFLWYWIVSSNKFWFFGFFKIEQGKYKNFHAENTRFVDYSVRFLALNLEDNPNWYGTLCM